MSNKGQGYAFRDDVLLCLHEHGFHTAARPGERHGVPLEQRQPRGDIVNLPITLAVKSGTDELKLSGALVEAQSEARAEGKDVFATIHRRRGHGVESSFVVTDMTTFLRLLSRLHPEIVST